MAKKKPNDGAAVPESTPPAGESTTTAAPQSTQSPPAAQTVELPLFEMRVGQRWERTTSFGPFATQQPGSVAAGVGFEYHWPARAKDGSDTEGLRLAFHVDSGQLAEGCSDAEHLRLRQTREVAVRAVHASGEASPALVVPRELDIPGTLAERRGEIEAQRIRKGFTVCQATVLQQERYGGKPGTRSQFEFFNGDGARWPVVITANRTRYNFAADKKVSQKNPRVNAACNKLFEAGIGLDKLADLLPHLEAQGLRGPHVLQTLGRYRKAWRERQSRLRTK